ncbi:MAG: hypothetical protein ACRD3T_12515 [Terriglobia bacterium]
MPGKRKSKRPRKLVSILDRVLDCVRREDYEDRGEFMVFGTSHVLYENDALRDMDKASKSLGEYRSRVRISRRTALNEDPDLESHLGRAGVSELGRQYVGWVTGGRAPAEFKLPKMKGHEDPTITSDLEQHFANELVRKLPKIVERVASLDEIGDEEIDKELVPDHVKTYWEEAHRCYLYGFNVACAVLCRAILESSLKANADPEGAIERSLPKGRSYFKELVESAKPLRDGVQGKDDRPCALDIKDAGDWAIHDIQRFNQTYGGQRLHEVLANTRKVLLDLYQTKETQ